jgi:N-acetylglucosaminyldiphosphoundecaprenol N-acetyl-beta-D-mannosaminyltransferase
MNSLNIQRMNLLGVGVSAVNMELAIAQIDRWIQSRSHNYICVTPVHSIMEC